MSMKWVRDTYGVPAKRGGRVHFAWPPESPSDGTIVGTDAGRLRVRLDGRKHTTILHPTWNVTYEETN